MTPVSQTGVVIACPSSFLVDMVGPQILDLIRCSVWPPQTKGPASLCMLIKHVYRHSFLTYGSIQP